MKESVGELYYEHYSKGRSKYFISFLKCTHLAQKTLWKKAAFQL